MFWHMSVCLSSPGYPCWGSTTVRGSTPCWGYPYGGNPARSSQWGTPSQVPPPVRTGWGVPHPYRGYPSQVWLGGTQGGVPPAGMGYTPCQVWWGVPEVGYPSPLYRTTDGVLDTPRSVCLLRSRRRTFLFRSLFSIKFQLMLTTLHQFKIKLLGRSDATISTYCLKTPERTDLTTSKGAIVDFVQFCACFFICALWCYPRNLS